jgi:hypothetical protein
MSTDDKAVPNQPKPDPPKPAVKKQKPNNKKASSKKPAAETKSEDTGDAESRALFETYERGQAQWRNSVRNHIGWLNAENVYFGHTAPGKGGGVRAGSVREDVMADVRNRYEPVDGFDDMRETLAKLRVLVLHGQPGSGRTMTALSLLDRLVDGGKLARLEVSKLKSLSGNSFKKEHGYVAELGRLTDGPLTETHLDRLRDELDKKKSFCVLVATSERRYADGLGGYAHQHVPPDTSRLLRKHVFHELREAGVDRPGVDDVMGLLEAEPELGAALGPSPRPAEIARFAAMLTPYARGEAELREVEQLGAQLVHDQVVEWFGDLPGLPTGPVLDEALRLAAFRISLAVFSVSQYQTVNDAAGKLAGLLVKSDPKRAVRFTDDQDQRLPAARACVVPGYVSFLKEKVSADLVEFEDERFPLVLLNYVWQNHVDLRAAIVKWLRGLSEDGHPMVWVRAAQAAGWLCSQDFRFVFQDLLQPEAEATGKNWWIRRSFAAIALDQAAQDDDVRRVVAERLKKWRREGTWAQKWTVAQALGYEHGKRSITATMEELRVLGTPSEQKPVVGPEAVELVEAAADSLAKLFAFGAVWPVLNQVRKWARSDRQSLRALAGSTLEWLIYLHGYHLNLGDVSLGREVRPLPENRERWPLLLGLQAANEDLRGPIAELLRWGLRARRSDWLARNLLAPWIRAAEEDEACLEALVQFLPRVVADHDDAMRLRHLVGWLRRDWCDPLADGVATKLEAALLPPRPESEAS